MHRSGTSLAASVLHHAGLQIGRKLNGAGPGNPRGHFEDIEIWKLHEEMLAAAGHTAFSAGHDFVPRRGDGFERRAAALIAARAGQAAWGWKDPRTCLFLDLWEPLVPEARYLVLYRHPADVALSLLRRDTEPELREDPRLAFRSWAVHNRRLLALLERNRSRCFVAHAHAVTTDVEGLVRRLAERFRLPLVADGAAAPFVPGDLAAPGSADERRPPWDRVVPEATELYARLQGLADLPGPEEPPAPVEDDTGGERQPAALRLSEALLFELMGERVLRRQQRAAAEGFARALEDERARLATLEQELAVAKGQAAETRARAAELDARLRDAAERRDVLAATLDAIERSRTFRLVSGWWRIAGRLRPRASAR
jgi:hypothetical protein